MSKCIKCNQDLKPNEIPAFFDGLCKDCWNKKQYETYPFKKGIADKDQQIAELKQQVKAKDILIDTYMSVVGTLTNAKNLLKQLEIRDKALNLAREYMFKGMCSDDVPCVEWFIKCAEEQVDG